MVNKPKKAATTNIKKQHECVWEKREKYHAWKKKKKKKESESKSHRK